MGQVEGLNKVTMNELDDLVVYGQVQYDFIVCGKTGCNYAESVRGATYRRAVRVEDEISAMSVAVNRRSRAAKDMGDALAKICDALACCSGSDIGVTKKLKDCDATNRDKGASAILAAYDLLSFYNLKYTDSGNELKVCGDLLKNDTAAAMEMTQGDISKAQSVVKLKLDTENNGLQQFTSTLQSLVSKRDSAYSMVSKLEKRINSTAASTIQSFAS